MSGPYLSANGARVMMLDLAIPYYGLPVADVSLATDAALVNPVTLAVGNLVLTMALDPRRSQVAFAGVTSARLIGGAGSWATAVRLAPYDRPAGVMLSTVIGDLAMATGTTPATRERVSLATGLDRSLGVRYVPETGAPASRLLALLAGPLWWIDSAGVTQVAATRPTSIIGTQANVDHYDGGAGWVRVATEDPASWLPGARYSSGAVPAGFIVSATRIHAGADGDMRLEVLTS